MIFLSKRQILLFIIVFDVVHSWGQCITHGPVFGAVSDSSVRVYIRAETPTLFGVEYGTNDHLINTKRIEIKTGDDNASVIFINNLMPSTKYHFRFYCVGNSDTTKGSFRTFPSPGSREPLTFVAGSCQETDNMKVFDVIPLHKPLMMLHTGDFTYPDYQISPDYAGNWGKIALSYRKRYEEKKMREMLHHIPIDYIYDDNDFVGSSGGRFYKNDARVSFEGLKVKNEFIEYTYPEEWRSNCIKGYASFFPAYPLPDTAEGIFHSFTMGNAEFFFVDRCANNTHPNSYAFQWDKRKKRWVFNPPPDHLMLGKRQMEWLKSSLKNSTADWKFIVSGAPFNKNIRLLIEAGLKLQKYGHGDKSGFSLASGVSHYFAGHATEMNEFYDFIEKERIRDVIVISGDTHHNAMDDGTNAGLPEMNASGMSVTGTHLAFVLDVLGIISGDYRVKRDIWNQGGNGIGNFNFKNAFGKIEIMGKDYVQLSLIDEDNEVISSFKVKHSGR